MRRKNHKKKRKTKSQDLIPTDLVFEILKRLPAKSVAKFLLVSKSWEAIIHSRDFIRSFPFRSSSSCLLIAYNYNDNRSKRRNLFFFSSSGTGQIIFDLISRTFHVPELRYNNETHHYVHGLMFSEYGQHRVITNPSIGKSITLPTLISRREIKKSFFGYDPVDDKYKVLCISKAIYGSGTRVAPSGHQVLTLGSSSKWRNIECSDPHHPISNSLCINGVLYYFALMGKNVMDQFSLVTFEVKSDKFSVLPIMVPADLNSRWHNLVCYKAKVAIAKQTSWYTFDLWILENAKKHEWSKICLSIHPPENMRWISPLRMIGSTNTGEIVLTLYDINGYLHGVYYDHQKNSQRIVEIQCNANDVRLFGDAIRFAEYMQSVMLL